MARREGETHEQTSRRLAVDRARFLLKSKLTARQQRVLVEALADSIEHAWWQHPTAALRKLIQKLEDE